MPVLSLVLIIDLTSGKYGMHAFGVVVDLFYFWLVACDF